METKSSNSVPLETNTAQLSKKAAWILRIIVVGLFSLWLMCVFYLRAQIRRDEAKVERNRIEAARRQEFQRRGAQYRQDLQNFNQGVRTRNVFDER